MINKILIEQIIKQLLKDISEITTETFSYSIEKENTYYMLITTRVNDYGLIC